MVYLCSIVAFAILTVLSPAKVDGRAVGEKRQDGFHWVNTWTSMPQLVEQNNMPPSPYSALKGATLRQTLRLSIPSGKASFTVPRGQVVVSDEVPITVAALSTISVSLYSEKGQTGGSITGHPGSRTTSWFAAGNKVNEPKLDSATSTLHWYFVSAVQAYVPTASSSLVILGDSITDGRGSDNDKNNRWPDLLLNRLHTKNHTNLAINNQAAGGNTRDAIEQPGVKYVMIFEGVNDIGGGANSAGTQTTIGDNLIKAYTQIVGDAKKAGYTTIGGTIMPFAGNSYAGTEREKARKRVNKWIMESKVFDHSVDLAGLVASKSNPESLDTRYNGGDGLHPNVAGYQAVADGFPIEIFNI
ncbi:SGNH hydrolase-type esterase domain-containing protein [Phaeosphaeriaceae sp. PMI808]|nr:SGNH hydrolase-type esterase domain-containing protein [Phaeosphaeriaceae sp. PMI808]